MLAVNPLEPYFGKSWATKLIEDMDKPYMEDIGAWISYCESTQDVCPPVDNMFKAFHLTPLEDIKVVILGQDPYHNGHADGLAFSSTQTEKWPYSIGPIFREIYLNLMDEENRIDFSMLFRSANLEPWANQGVLLLNTALSVEKDKPMSHTDVWKDFTRAIVSHIAQQDRPIVWMLWGAQARSFRPESLPASHLVLTSGHPAAGAYGEDTFTGKHHFSKCRDHFMNHNLPVIDWRLNPLEEVLPWV